MAGKEILCRLIAHARREVHCLWILGKVNHQAVTVWDSSHRLSLLTCMCGRVFWASGSMLKALDGARQSGISQEQFVTFLLRPFESARKDLVSRLKGKL